jgi:Concanavalin A-like lectin/glucanases superfamily
VSTLVGGAASMGGGESLGGSVSSGGAPGGGSMGPSGGLTSESGGAASNGGSGGSFGGGMNGGAPSGGSGVTALLDEFDVYWDFETSDGDSVLPTVGSEPLTLAGAALGDGPDGRLLNFGAGNVSAATERAVVDTSSDFSVAAWVKLDQLDGYDTFVSTAGAAVSSLFLQRRTDGRFSLTTLPSDSTSATACVTNAEIQPRLGEWYLLVGTRDSATREQRIYVDGVLSGKNICPEGTFAAEGPITVGRGLYGGEASDFMQGAVDGVGLISRTLSPGDVFDLYQAGRPDAEHFLFAYFVEVTEGRGDGLRLAHSHDGLHWGAIGAGKAFLAPTVGGRSFRDPHVMRGPDGQYHVVWTTSCVPWAEANCVQDRGFGHAVSPDLVHFGQADYVTVDLNVEHVWAPETFYDSVSQNYMVFWSSPIDQNPSASDPHNIYYILTSDFRSFSEPAILYSKAGRNFIDATIRPYGDEFFMVLKDEADGQKNLRALRSASLYGTGAWSDEPSAPITGNYAAEGPSFLERGDDLFVYFDKYGEGAYGALRATPGGSWVAPSTWQDISSTVFFPGVRHGTPIVVPSDVFRAVALAAGE